MRPAQRVLPMRVAGGGRRAAGGGRLRLRQSATIVGPPQATPPWSLTVMRHPVPPSRPSCALCPALPLLIQPSPAVSTAPFLPGLWIFD